ncbi:hypothetical protein GIB67_018204 [Kingdonia uniflora]|uniref:mannose-6-phosphate isomerase n=1 Tax=Kingdonia uniflora TaxID=39325 RepID=A0A7J7NN12_9MAGN|nr:hypothetical protein GIB67_018204 [Kingdonia uniflora]
MVEQSVRNEVKKLVCGVQSYDWGKIGGESMVAKLFSLNSGVEIELDKPYAEFWMGTHESGPSFVIESCGDGNGDDHVSLKEWVAENPSVLGDKVVKKWGNDLPFLFKVLSVAKALSIQAHPDKELARTLHKLRPSIYKDDNHKPEMALALTEFEALCGFVSMEELKDVICSVPEVTELVGNAYADQVLHVKEQDGKEEVKAVLQSIFTQLMSLRQLTDKERLVIRLDKQYPSDVGVISAFFLNYVNLNPGEALYLGANEPHAYIFGECIECMATSDNVVRAGLTPKLRDVPTLCSMLTYKQGFPEILCGVPLNQHTKRYSPPFDEFEVDCCILPQGAKTVFPAISGPSLFVVASGEGTMQTDSSSYEEEVSEGDVLFVSANTQICITSTSGLELYRAGVNSRLL